MGDFRWALLVAGGALILLIYGWTLWRSRQRRAAQIWRDASPDGDAADLDDAPAVRGASLRSAAPESVRRPGRRVSDPDDPAPDALLAELSSLGRLMHEEASVPPPDIAPVRPAPDAATAAPERQSPPAAQDDAPANVGDPDSAIAAKPPQAADDLGALSATSAAAAPPEVAAPPEAGEVTSVRAVKAAETAIGDDALRHVALAAAAKASTPQTVTPSSDPPPPPASATVTAAGSPPRRRAAAPQVATPSIWAKLFTGSLFRRNDPPPPPQPRLPELILVLYVVAKPATTFAGQAIREALDHVGLRPGMMAIYHRMPAAEADADNAGKPIFSVADMLEPGHLQPDALDDHSTPGLSVFMRLPGGAVDGPAAFEDMYQSCRQIAELLQGELRDEQRCVLTRQTVDHLRERVIEWRRQTQLARLKQGAEQH